VTLINRNRHAHQQSPTLQTWKKAHARWQTLKGHGHTVLSDPASTYQARRVLFDYSLSQPHTPEDASDNDLDLDWDRIEDCAGYDATDLAVASTPLPLTALTLGHIERLAHLLRNKVSKEHGGGAVKPELGGEDKRVSFGLLVERGKALGMAKWVLRMEG